MTKDIIKKNKHKILFFLIILLAITIRLINWPNVIDGIHVDEAMTAINAKTIADKGTDIYGTSYPIFFEAWRWGGQTAFLTYIMSFFIKLLGFNMVAIRIPMLIISIISIIIIYLFTKDLFKNKNVALIAMLMTAISPWHIQQVYFSLDCNMFPHIMLIGLYVLYKGINNNKNAYIYLSMVFWGLTMYTYGLAIYFVPIFLLILAIYLLKIKKVRIYTIIISAIIYLLISLPMLAMLFMNFFKIETISLGNITIPFCESFERKSDILIFSDNIFIQLCYNIKNLLQVLVLQYDAQEWNAIPFFGTTYVISIVFFIYGLIKLKNENIKTEKFIIYTWLLIAIGIGILVKDVTIYKINIIWYPIIIIISYGIYYVCKNYKNKFKYIQYIILALYIVMTVFFLLIFNNLYANKVDDTILWDAGLVDAVKYIEEETNHTNVMIYDYNSYRYFERTKVFVRFVTNYDIDKYNNEILENIQYTDKYHISKCQNINETLLNEYDACIVPSYDYYKKEFTKKNYRCIEFENYIVCEK